MSHLRMTPEEVAAYQKKVRDLKAQLKGEAIDGARELVRAVCPDASPAVVDEVAQKVVDALPGAKRTARERSKVDYEDWLERLLIAHKLPPPARQFMWSDDRQYRADLAYPPLLIEVQGAAHRIKGRFLDDILKVQAAAKLHYIMVPIATSQVRSGEAVTVIEELLDEYDIWRRA